MAGSALLRSSAIGGLVLAALQLPWCPRLSVSKQLLAGCLLGYLASVLDGSEKRPGCRRSPWLLRVVQRFWNQVLPRLFNIDCSLEDEEGLRKCGHCVVAVHPHGVLSLGHYLVISGFHPDLERALPASRRCALSAGVLFKLPGVRELALGLGCVDAHRDVAKRCLSNGLSISVVPGGEREQLLAQRGKVEQLVLAQRQGFVRLALQHGVPIVPVYVFGEAQLFKQSRILMGFRSWVQRTLGVALVMPYGPWGMPWQKYPDPVRIVVGKPLAMPRIPDPSKADVAEHHSKYVEELGKLFERHKAGAGYPDSSLQIAMGQDVGPYADDPKISSGKGKAKGKAPTKSVDAGAAKGGKKGAPGGKGKGAPSLSKSPVAPSKAMKPLWWKRLLFGTDLQPGAIWERVRDETQSLPAEELEHRFAKAQAQAPSKPTGPSPTGASEVIRIRTDAVQDRELRLLPSPAECGRALAELEDQRLALDELERLQRAVCPTKRELELLEEEYWEQLRLIPSFEQRMECWHFIRTYRERDLLDIFQSLEKSEAVPSLLALILATGIWMNRGTEFAAAKGFGIEFLEKLHSIKGADGKSLQHLLFVVFFDSLDSQAAEFVEALGPLLQNVSRRVIQDSEETKISKAVHLSLEECDEAVSSIHETALDIQASLQKCTGGLDPSDPVKLRLHREFATATKMIESLVQLRNSVKSQYDRVLQWFHAPGWRSADFFLLWDNFLLPSDLLAARCRDGQSPAPDARSLDVEATFCQARASGALAAESLKCSDDRFLGAVEGEGIEELRLEELGRDLAEEGDPPFQRTLMHEADSLRLTMQKELLFNLLQFRPFPAARTKFSAAAIADAEQRKVAREASAARWSVLVQQLPRQEDVVHLLEDLDLAKDSSDCTVQQLSKVETDGKDTLLAEASEGPEISFRRALDAERLLFTMSMMTYRQKATSCVEGLEDFLDVVECFKHSKALPEYLSLILATGNYLNGGTPRGQADGFDLSELEKLTGIQDADGKDLRHFVLQVFCQQMPVQAEQLFAELRPCFLNVRRSISKDALGTAKLSKTVLQAIEALDEEVSALQVSLKQAEEAVRTVVGSQTSPAAHERLTQNLAEASAFVNETVAFRDDVKAAFRQPWFRV
ncbi:DGAT2 [Symbiodinium necroappetens]|uniref:diacylglycerol O-acyltransferase n=1 Tax=Symbiodinium necroappetens TaxID=1628268 RepID=A0A812SFJ5_9DINO|nr:DGAT2 [Symbiodinium necroappetens]